MKECKDCKWWDRQLRWIKNSEGQLLPKEPIVGWCKRMPHTEAGKSKDDWCGEFEAKE